MNFCRRYVGMSDFVLSVLSGLCPGFLPWVQPFCFLERSACLALGSHWKNPRIFP